MNLLWLLGFVFALGGAPTEYRLTDDFGAIPDDGMDDAPALRAALEQAVTEGGVTLIIPPGTYEIDSRVCVTGAVGVLRIEGRGHNISRLMGNNHDGVLKIVSTDPRSRVEIRDLDVVPSVPSAGTGLDLSKPYSEPATLTYNLLLNAVEMRCDDRMTDYFDRSIVLDGWMPLIDTVATSGPYGPDITEVEQAWAESSIVMRRAYRPRIRYCYFWSSRMGVDIEFTDTPEAPVLDGVVSVGTGHGIRIVNTGGALTHPLRIVKNHWNPRTMGLTLENVDGFQVVENVPYHQPSEYTSGDYRDVNLIASSQGVIEDNVFWFGGDALRPLVFADADSEAIVVRHNHFGNQTSKQPVVPEEGSRNILVQSNVYGSVYANDEANTFGLWNMETNAAGQIADVVTLGSPRNNPLVLSGGAQSRFEGSTSPEIRPALFFDEKDHRADSTQNWPGSRGVMIDAYIYRDSGALILVQPDVYRLRASGDDLVFEFTGCDETVTELVVEDAVRKPQWRRVRAEVNPETGMACLEVDGVGSDRRVFDSLELASASFTLRVSPQGFIGAVDQLWIRSLR
ncbi:hypothetical protein [Kiritimatiella glycovorans]|uniref:Pectate lyase superfamily protein domain-containing protein n=1 Tax=Kiritimatiella glycovorans TaxID=1307763 RepID=A0A0G3EH96_9BACT|nr:hypothetical protein [Kiritimatiella glycovorans]AKJ64195.1 hypothetical protein L21SP4_00933 [Kiritimatiella glycovorans]